MQIRSRLNKHLRRNVYTVCSSFFRAPVCIHVGETTFLESIIASSPRQRHAAGIKTLFSGGRARRWCRRADVSSSVVVRVVLVTSSLYSDVIKWRQTSSSRIIDVMRRRMTVAIWRAQHPHLPSTWAAVRSAHPRRISSCTIAIVVTVV